MRQPILRREVEGFAAAMSLGPRHMPCRPPPYRLSGPWFPTVWREGDVPIKVSGPHKALISRFELSTFPHPFPRDEGGTGIRTLGWHEPARLCTDHMHAARRCGSLRRLVASQMRSCTRYRRWTCNRRSESFLRSSRLRQSACDLPESGTIGACSQTEEQEREAPRCRARRRNEDSNGERCNGAGCHIEQCPSVHARGWVQLAWARRGDQRYWRSLLPTLQRLPLPKFFAASSRTHAGGKRRNARTALRGCPLGMVEPLILPGAEGSRPPAARSTVG